MKAGDLVMFRYWTNIRSAGVIVSRLPARNGFYSYVVMFEGKLHDVNEYDLIKVKDERE